MKEATAMSTSAIPIRVMPSVMVAVLSATLLMTACRGVDDNNGGGGNGELTLGISDGPVDEADEVRIAFSGVEITPVGGMPMLIENLEEDFIDFLDLSGGERELLLDEFDLADGTYDSIRLIVNEMDSFVDVGGSRFNLVVPPGEEMNLLLDVNVFFDEDNDLEDLTIDVDLRKSIRVDNTQSPPVYEFHPNLRVVETSRSETLRGTVHEDFIEDTRCANQNNNEDGNAVYLFVGNSGGFQDLQNNAGDPFATTGVEFNTASNQWEFAFGFLPRQSYRLVFTCDAILDDPEQDDFVSMDFEGPIIVDVRQGNTETVAFEP